MSAALIVVYAIRELDMSPAALGLAFSLGNVGPLLAAFTTSRISNRLGVGPTILWTAVLFSTSSLFLPLAPKSYPLPFLVAFGVIAGFAGVAYNITQVSFRQAICPERMQGRMNSVIRFLVWGTMPLGALLGGALGTVVRASPRAVGRSDRRALRVPPDPPLARAQAARDARAGRGAAAVGDRGLGRAARGGGGASARCRLTPAQRYRS